MEIPFRRVVFLLLFFDGILQEYVTACDILSKANMTLIL